MTNQPTHAAYVSDNFDGENNRHWVFAYVKDGVFYSFESGKPLLQYQGDEILKLMSLSCADKVEKSKPQAYVVSAFIDACFEAEGDIEETGHAWDLNDVRDFAEKYNKNQ